MCRADSGSIPASRAASPNRFIELTMNGRNSAAGVPKVFHPTPKAAGLRGGGPFRLYFARPRGELARLRGGKKKRVAKAGGVP